MYIGELLKSMQEYDAGVPYDLYLCANGEDYKIPEDLMSAFTNVFVRENRGYNIGAWDHAWRMLTEYKYYLLMQDDCFIKKKGWLLDFFRCFNSTKDCGLVGECLNKVWNHSWLELTGNTGGGLSKANIDESLMRRARNYLNLLQRWGIPAGETARHLTSVVHFTSRAILEKVDGYNKATTYEEAIAAEIGFSKKIEARGYKLIQIGRYRHSRIGHREWLSDSFLAKLKRSFQKRWKTWGSNRISF